MDYDLQPLDFCPLNASSFLIRTLILVPINIRNATLNSTTVQTIMKKAEETE